MKTHYLDFKTSDKQIFRMKVTKEFWAEKVKFMIGDEENGMPSFSEKKEHIVFDSKTERTFTMADFTGQSGQLKNYSPTPNRLPAGEEKRDEGRISEIIEGHRKKYNLNIKPSK